MVEVGFLDIETALLVVKQSLHLRVDEPKCADVLSFSEQIRRAIKVRRGGLDSAIEKIWDWEKESKIWEAREDFERWAAEVRLRNTTSKN